MVDERTGPVTVIGAGAMGRGIAYIAAAGGFEVRLLDVDEAILDDARHFLERTVEEGVARGKLDADAAANVVGSVTTTTRMDTAASDAVLVVEAAPESLSLKRELLVAAQDHAAPTATIATNTSALSVTEILSALSHPERGIGMHFFNPVPRMKLCEIVVGLQTSADTIAAARRAAAGMDRACIVVRDMPGFVTSRLNAALGNEAMRMLQEGVATAADIDRGARRALNHPMGPLEMVDLVGLDVRLAVLEHLRSRLGERFRPPPLHHRLVAAGRLGRKTGTGIYRYENGVRIDEETDLDPGPATGTFGTA